jgi:ribosomal protein S18 acetylase RimI-like enzyme
MVKIIKLTTELIDEFILFRNKSNKETEYINKINRQQAEEILNQYNISGNKLAYVLIKHNKIIGQLFLDLGIKNKENILCILLISVLKEFQGQGYGKQLISLSEKLAKENKLNILELIVDKNNSYAIKFYEKLGFKYIKPFSSTALIYQKTLLEKSNLMTKW